MPKDHIDNGVDARRASAERLARAKAHLDVGDISQAARLLKDVDAASLSGGERDEYRHLILATGLYGADTIPAARALCRTLPFDFAPALRHRFALKDRDPRVAKRIRSHDGAAAAHGADFGWSTALRCLWDGKMGPGLALYRHRHGARSFWTLRS